MLPKHDWLILHSEDLMKLIHQFGNLHVANIVLLPKKDGAEDVLDFRPIILIHAVAKIIAKVLALRLALLIDGLVSNSQSAFIKKCNHNNFLYLAKRFHKSKTLTLLFKLNIRKAFDSIRWEFIMGLLQRRGYPSRFLNWITTLLTRSSSRVLLNGIAGNPILHGRGLRQGDPLSALLFVLSIDPLTQILEGATRHGLLHKLCGRGTILRTSIYADDAAVFLAPFKEDIQNAAQILDSFGEVTGLCMNILKSSVVLIHYNSIDLDEVLGGLPITRASFPLKYLGLPLSV
jgi:mannosylglycoprotein endo-beta-mannosidase